MKRFLLLMVVCVLTFTMWSVKGLAAPSAVQQTVTRSKKVTHPPRKAAPPAVKLPKTQKMMKPQSLDTNRIRVSSPSAIMIGSQVAGVTRYGGSMRIEHRRGGYLLAYEAIVDAEMGGHVQGLVAFLDENLQQRGEIALFDVKHEHSFLQRLLFYTIPDRADIPDRGTLCIYQARNMSPTVGYGLVQWFWILGSSDHLQQTTPFQANGEYLRALDILAQPGEHSMTIFYNKKDESCFRIIDTKGQTIFERNPIPSLDRNWDGHNDGPAVFTAVARGEDGGWLAGLKENTIIFIDPYGLSRGSAVAVAEGVYAIFPMGNGNYMIQHRARQPDFSIFYPHANSELRPIQHPEPVQYGQSTAHKLHSGNYLITVVVEQEGGNSYDLHAFVINDKGVLVKGDQKLMQGVREDVAFTRMKSGDLLILGDLSGGTPGGKRYRFQYVVVKE